MPVNAAPPRRLTLLATPSTPSPSVTIDAIASRPLHWVPVAPGHVVLPLGPTYGQVHVLGEGSTWRVCVMADAASRPHHLARDIDLDTALTLGEEEAARVGATALNRPEAPWRAERATPAQRQALRAFGQVDVWGPMTKGEGMDRLVGAIALASRRHLGALSS